MSDTPITDKAKRSHSIEERGSEPHEYYNEVYAEDMEALERSHNALIAKLEALAKEWDNSTDPAFNTAGSALNNVIWEAKQ